MKKLNYTFIIIFLMFLRGTYYAQNFNNDTIPVFSVPMLNDNPIVDVPPNTQSENSVFISPLNKNIVLNSNNSLFGGGGGANFFISNDGGDSWPFGTILGAGQNNSGDPATAIGRFDNDGDGNGRIFVNFINSQNGQSIAYSDDNGQNWIVRVVDNTGSPGFHDKNHMWIDNMFFRGDNGASNINEGNIYVGWRPADRHIWVSTSVDNGDNWINLLQISSNLPVGASDYHWGINLQTGNNGQVYAVWSTIYGFSVPNQCFEDAISFTISLNGGLSWDNAYHIIENIHGILGSAFGCVPSLGGGKSMRTNGFPSMTVNQQNGHIFIVWANVGEPCGSTNPPGCNTGNPDIYMIRSTGQGGIGTWSNPIRVNQDVTNDQWFPWIACDEASGALVVVYYDSREFQANDLVCTYVSISYDEGDTWQDFRISDNIGDWDGDGFSGSYSGDYIGIDVYHGLAVPVWSDDRTGSMLAYTDPFEIPCPQDLNLISGNYSITNEYNFAPDANYKVLGTITVAGSGSTYKVHAGAEVLMEAGEEIVLNDGFESEGEFVAMPNPTCTSFSEKWDGNGGGSTNSHIGSIAVNPPENPINKKDELVKKIAPAPDIYPNPTNGKFIVIFNDPTGSLIQVTNPLGEVVFIMKTFHHKTEIDLSSSPAGLYFVKVITGDEVFVQKFIISK